MTAPAPDLQGRAAFTSSVVLPLEKAAAFPRPRVLTSLESVEAFRAEYKDRKA